MNTALESIEREKEQILYRKVVKNGQEEYVPANDPWAHNGLREGWWLVKVEPGSTSIRQCVNPARAEVQAAFMDAEEKLVGIIRKAAEARPKNKKITPEFKKDWEEMIEKHGPEMNYLEYDSLYGIAQTILKEIKK